MIQYLWTGEIKCVTYNEINKSDVSSVQKDSEEGYILEVFLKYPNYLHDLNNEYPLASEKTKFGKRMLSNGPKKY